MKKWIILVILIIFLSISAHSISYSSGIYTSQLYGATTPIISLISPSNNSIKTIEFATQSIDFVFSVSVNSSVCNLFYDNSKRANSTNSLNSVTITASATGFGIGQWFVNCTDNINGVVGQSGFFNLDVQVAQSTGGGATASPAIGGGGQGLPNISFTKEYICSKVNIFVGSITLHHPPQHPSQANSQPKQKPK